MPRYINVEWLMEKIREREYPLDDDPLTTSYGLSTLGIFRILEEAPTVSTDEVRSVGDWVPFTTRPMTEEERQNYSEQYGYDIEYEEAVIYTSELPDDLQEILVCDKWGRVWIDTFLNDPDYGISLEDNGDMDGVLGWMPKPKPMKGAEDG